MPYLDVIRRLRDASNLPIAAYQVSGEYAMLKAAAQKVRTLSYMLQFTMYLLLSLDLLFVLINSTHNFLYFQNIQKVFLFHFISIYFLMHLLFLIYLFIYLFIPFLLFFFAIIKLVDIERV